LRKSTGFVATMTRSAPVGPIIYLAAFSAPMIALTIAGSAPRQMKTLVPATSISIKCGRVGEGGTGGSDKLQRAASVSTTTGTKPSASAPSGALRRASRRHV